ncbi:MAG: ComEA family DNA-binding protein [Chloroflexota bacterium]|nr:ComEA family DNA-binding protein [Chloroflexota bacterium]
MPSRVTILASLFAVLGGIILVLAIYRQLDLRDAPPIVIRDPLESETIVVAVDGAVASPGVVTLRHDARWGDAIAAAGGTLPAADLATINQALRLNDGDRVIVPTRTIAPPPPSDDPTVVPGGTDITPGISGPAEPEDTAVPAATLVTGEAITNLNTATEAQLEALPEIGAVLAGRIVEYRSRVGRFDSVDDLASVDGISDRIVEVLRPLVTV